MFAASGNSELIRLIHDEIQAARSISFARFIELALYHPGLGFYAADRARLGRSGDYFTNVSVGVAFATLLGWQFVQLWHVLGKPAVFHLVEQGAHHGEFARDLLESLRTSSPDFFEKLQYRIIEPAPALKERQSETLRAFTGKVSWAESVEQLDPFSGAFFSNELIDAFPVHLIAWSGEGWSERRVVTEGEGFAFKMEPARDPELVRRIASLPRRSGSYDTEVSLAAPRWIGNVASRIERGCFIAIDYGLGEEDYYSEERKSGTLQIRKKHRLLASPFEEIGQADITAHVEWTSLVKAGESAGLKFLGLPDQHHFLTGILSRSPDFLSQSDAKVRRQLQTLLHPEMLGRSFQALVMSRGLETLPEIAGLKFAGTAAI